MSIKLISVHSESMMDRSKRSIAPARANPNIFQTNRPLAISPRTAHASTYVLYDVFLCHTRLYYTSGTLERRSSRKFRDSLCSLLLWRDCYNDRNNHGKETYSNRDHRRSLHHGPAETNGWSVTDNSVNTWVGVALAAPYDELLASETSLKRSSVILAGFVLVWNLVLTCNVEFETKLGLWNVPSGSALLSHHGNHKLTLVQRPCYFFFLYLNHHNIDEPLLLQGSKLQRATLKTWAPI